MVINRSKFLYLLGVSVMLLMVACKSNKIDISGGLQGVWKTDWEENKVEGGLTDMEVSETIAFLNDTEAGSAGKFRQVFIGTVNTEASQKVFFAIVIGGEWQVVDVNGLKLIYNLDNMSTEIFKNAPSTFNSKTALELLKGNWNESVSTHAIESESDKFDSTTEGAIKPLITTYFRDLFREINKDKVAWKDVVIDGKIMTVKVSGGLFGKEVIYSKTDEDAKDLAAGSSSVSDSPTEISSTQQDVLPESSVAPVKKSHSSYSTPSGLPNYDWLSSRYVTHEDLAYKSGSQLRIMRNYIYARHGYSFKSADLQRYFAQYPWYTPRYSDVSHMLSSTEMHNVSTIKAYE